jgi:phosphoglycerate dehydrogenase-like enzyme
MKFVFLDQDVNRDFINGNEVIAPLKKLGEVCCYDDDPCPQEELYERASDADVIIFSINQLGNPLIEKLAQNKKLKHIQFMGIGYKSYVDEEFCRSLGISVLGVGEYGSNAIAEYAIALMLSSIRGIAVGDRRMKKHEWNMKGLLGGEIAGSTVGVVGTGAIGRLVAQKLHLLGAEVIAFDIREDRELIEKYGVRYVSLEKLMRTSDIVSVHLKYTSQTEKIISAEMLSLMKPEAVFINTARAQVVDYDALLRMLKDGKISAAAVDVHYGEPPHDWDLVCMDNVIATPHIAYFTAVANTNLLRKSVESVLKNIAK